MIAQNRCFALMSAIVALLIAIPSAADEQTPKTAEPIRAIDKTGAQKALKQAVELLDNAKLSDSEQVRRGLSLIRLQFELATLSETAGDRKLAEQSLRKAQALVEAAHESTKFNELRGLAECYAQLGDIPAIVKIADSIPETVPNSTLKGPMFRRMLLQEAAAAAGRQGRVDVGLELAKRIDDLSTREWVERMVRRAGIVHRARHGDFVGAKRAIADLPSELDKAGALVGSVTTANGLPYSTGRDEWGLALIQLENRDFDGARANAKQAAENLDQIPENSRSSIAAAAIRALARAGDIEASQSLVEKVTSPRLRLQSETEIAAARVRKGNEKDALAFIDALSKDDDKIYALYQIAYAQSKNNNRVGADASLQKAIDLCAKNKNKGMHEIASTQAAIGDVEGAALSATKSRSEVTWSNILYSQVKAGDFAGAIKTLDRLNQWRRGESIALIADALARNGDEARAENWAKEQTDDVYKAYAYAGLAKGLLRVVP